MNARVACGLAPGASVHILHAAITDGNGPAEKNLAAVHGERYRQAFSRSSKGKLEAPGSR
jgi:hypothetical protein